MKLSLEQGFEPDYISNALAMTNVHSITYDLLTTVFKVVTSGLSLTEALAECTYAPAVKMGREKEIGFI